MQLRAFIFLFFTFFVNVIASCPNGSFEFQHYCYFFEANKTSFQNAELSCITLNGHLASIHDGFSNSMITGQAVNFFDNNFWIGLNSLKGNWSWTDNTSFDFNEWSVSQPQNSSLNCGNVNLKNGLWNGDDCTKTKSFVCKVAAPTPPNPSNMNCTEGWIYFEPTDSCYGHDGYQNLRGNWSEGEEYCQSVDAHLFSFHSYDEFRFLSSINSFTQYFYWTGLYRSSSNDSSWQWSDGSPVDYPIPWDNQYGNYSSCATLHKNKLNNLWKRCDDLYTTIICKKAAIRNITEPTITPTSEIPANSSYINCTEGWIYFEPTNSCYGKDGYYPYIFTNWTSAEQYCQSKNAHLISIHNYDEFRFFSTISGFVLEGFYWTGLYSNDNNEDWQWSDGTPIDFQIPWGTDYPKGNTSSCAYLYQDAVYDRECTYMTWIICKKPAF